MILHGDCVEKMREMEDASVDAVVTDPPYGLEFMGKSWDRLGDVGTTSHSGPAETAGGERGQYGKVSYGGSANKKCRTCGKWAWDYPERKCVCETPDFPSIVNHQSRLMQEWHFQWATEAFRVLKPGGYLLAFGGTRTVHRLASAIEDAGFEIRDELVWIYASGFPKSLDVGKAMDARLNGANEKVKPITAPATDLARQWDGWGTALKPAHEPIVMARKPLTGTVAGNVARYGTGALNIDGTRIGGPPRTTHKDGNHQGTHPAPMSWGQPTGYEPPEREATPDEWLPELPPEAYPPESEPLTPQGRWPSNVLLSDPELFDVANPYVVGSGATDAGGGYGVRGQRTVGESWASRNGDANVMRGTGETVGYGDSGGYSRFFIVPKADRADREPTLRGATERTVDARMGLTRGGPGEPGKGSKEGYEYRPAVRANHHPTVKPTDLMRHLVRLVTPPGGLVLDPFLGSGSTGIACEMEGFRWIGIEKEAEYVAIAEARLNGVQRGLGLVG